MGTPPDFAMFFGTWSQREMEMSYNWEIFRDMPAGLKAELAAYYYGVFVAETIPDRTLNDDTPCLWYDEATRRCRHYEHRPTTCREFKIGCEGCLSHRERCGIGGRDVI